MDFLSDHSTLLISLSMGVFACSLSAVGAWYVLQDDSGIFSKLSNQGSDGPGGSPISGGDAPALNINGSKSLPLPSESSSEWNMQTMHGGEVTQGAFKVTYVKGKYTATKDSGCIFNANPFKMFPAQRGGMGCKVFVPNDFDFKNGGKLGPGVCVGKCATGGNYQSDGGSARLTFDKDGVVYAYLYIPSQVKNQTDDYEDAAHRTGQGRTGDKLLGSTKLNKGQWNSLAVGVDAASNGKPGRVDIWVNGKQEGISVVWTDSNLQVTAAHFSTFFGGNDPSYAPTKTQSLLFKDFFVF